MTSVTAEAATLLMILIGATAKHTKLVMLLIFPLISAPAAMIASRGIPKSLEKAGSSYTPLKAVPNTVITKDPARQASTAFFLVFLNI